MGLYDLALHQYHYSDASILTQSRYRNYSLYLPRWVHFHLLVRLSRPRYPIDENLKRMAYINHSFPCHQRQNTPLYYIVQNWQFNLMIPLVLV